MSELLNLWHSIVGIVRSSDAVTLIIMVIVAVGTGFVMRGMSSLVTATFGALVLFGVANFVRGAIAGKSAAALAQSDWHSLLALQVHVLLAYAIAFAMVIAIVRVIRSAERRD